MACKSFYNCDFCGVSIPDPYDVAEKPIRYKGTTVVAVLHEKDRYSLFMKDACPNCYADILRKYADHLVTNPLIE